MKGPNNVYWNTSKYTNNSLIKINHYIILIMYSIKNKRGSHVLSINKFAEKLVSKKIDNIKEYICLFTTCFILYLLWII